jgi:pimeloyl-ACP methyl ester carboxylesterase
MESSFVEIEDLKIRYLEKNKKGTATIFFIHGNSGSSRTWNDQLNDPLFNNYRLIAIDLPGHGKSSDSKDPAKDYSPLGTGKIIADAVCALKKDLPYGLVGFSYGTNIIAEVLNYEINPEGVVLIGTCVIGDGVGIGEVLTSPETSIYFRDDITEEAAKDFLSGRIESVDGRSLETYLEDFIATRPPFRSTLIQTAIEGKVSDEISLLKKGNIPLLIVFGLGDDYLHINYLDKINLQLWNNAIYKLPGAGHYVQTDIPEILDQLLFNYLEDRFRASHS